ncbi:MAG: DciA family protein [Bacteroidia bacterium]
MSRHNEHNIKEVIEQLLKAYKLDDKLAERRLIASWENVMGAMIAKHTKDLYIKHQQLFVTLDSAALRNELSLAKTKIVKMLNDEVGSQVIVEVILR